MDLQLMAAGAVVALLLFEAFAWWKGVDSTDTIDSEEWNRRWTQDH
jgi:hypothetical protein